MYTTSVPVLLSVFSLGFILGIAVKTYLGNKKEFMSRKMIYESVVVVMWTSSMVSHLMNPAYEIPWAAHLFMGSVVGINVDHFKFFKK